MGLHFRELGAGPTLLMLHPVGLDGTFWEGVAQPLSAHCKVITVDTMGHGGSQDASRPGRMADRVSDVVQLIEERKLGPVVVLGVSFGGMIAQNVALTRPDLVRGLVLGGCPGRMPPEAHAAILKRGADAEAGGMQAIVDATLERWFTPGFLSTEAVKKVRQRLLGDKPSNWAAAWEAILQHDALPRLGTLTMPALVVAGEDDLATPLEAKRALAAALPKGRLAVLAGAPHMMQIEQPGAFLEVVRSFLGEIGALQT